MTEDVDEDAKTGANVLRNEFCGTVQTELDLASLTKWSVT
jgi:hypothetical protein